MKIKREDILHLTSLSNFSLSESEIESLGADLEHIINYISELDQLDTEGIEPTYQVLKWKMFGEPMKFSLKRPLASSS